MHCFLSSWCRLHHQRKVKGVSVVIVEGLTQSDFYKHFLTMRRLRTNYTTVSKQWGGGTFNLTLTVWFDVGCCLAVTESHFHSIN